MFIIQVIIQVLAFVRKELFGTLRQPRLILSLVLGPFLILALFGLGYEGKNSYSTTLVVPNRDDISTNPAEYKDLSRQTFVINRVTKNEQEAVGLLNRNETQAVIVVPENALDEVYNGKNAKFPVYYRNLNPVQANFLEYSTYVYASEFDKVILRQALQASKPQQSQLQETTSQLNSTTEALDKAMQSNNIPEAKLQAQKLRGIITATRLGIGSLLLPGAGDGTSREQNLLGGKLTGTVVNSGKEGLNNNLNNSESKLNALDDGFNRGDANSSQQRANLDSLKGSNQELTDRTNKIANIPPAVMVEPVLASAKNLVSTSVTYTNFYGPAVIILLLQHIAITLASLSNVRDRLIGAMEIYRVAPIGATQILTGKFIGFTIILLVLAGLLTALITQLLGVPFINFFSNWWMALVVLFATIYASIGMGYLIGGLSRSESQAVQLSMIALLSSIFFTGFVVPLSQFTEYVRWVGYLFPMTYGSYGLQNTMLDSRPLDPFYIYMPFLLGTVYLVLGRILYRRQFNIG